MLNIIKPILNQFNIGQWVWIFDPNIIPGSCDKLRSYWAGPYKIVRLMAPALAEVIAVYEQGKPRIVSLDILKEFREETNVHGLPTLLETHCGNSHRKCDLSHCPHTVAIYRTYCYLISCEMESKFCAKYLTS